MFEKVSPTMMGYALQIIELAESKMNSGGAHWVKGYYKKMMRFKGKKRVALDKWTYKPVEKGDRSEACYCMIGGLNAASRELPPEVRKALPLAKKLVASQIKGREITRITSIKGYRWDDVERDGAQDIIIGFNDAFRTEWRDVRKMLRAAARVARKRAA